MSSGVMFVWQLPKESTHNTCPASPPLAASTSGSMSGVAELGSTSGPRSPSVTSPAARRAAAGANTSRPSNVTPSRGRRYSGFSRATIRSAPPTIATAGASTPLSGPTSSPQAVVTAIGRRSVPTPGSTTARATPSGRYWIARTSVSAPAWMSPRGTLWVMSMTRDAGAMRARTAWTTPTNSSSRPKSDRKLMGRLTVRRAYRPPIG